MKPSKDPSPSTTIATDEICFYQANDRNYGPLSNFYRRAILFEGVVYPTAEHAYQAGKPRKAEVRSWLMAAPSAALLAMAAEGLDCRDISRDWSSNRFKRMRDVLRAKFTQNRDLTHLLLSTGNSRLVETPKTQTPVNRIWGEVNGAGANMLGKLLMEIRDELKSDLARPWNDRMPALLTHPSAGGLARVA